MAHQLNKRFTSLALMALLFTLNGYAVQHESTDIASPSLLDAVARDDLQAVQDALHAGIDPDISNENYWTLLHIAASQGCVSVAKLLLQSGANKEAKIPQVGATPLYLAAQNGHLPVVEALIQAGADKEVKTDNFMTPLYIAAKWGHTSVIKALLPTDPDKKVKFLKELPFISPIFRDPCKNGFNL